MTEYDEAAAAEVYATDEGQETAGAPRRLRTRDKGLTTHVPIRFSASTIERVRVLASEDGKTVSSWIRDVVEREVVRRQKSATRTDGALVFVSFAKFGDAAESTPVTEGEELSFA